MRKLLLLSLLAVSFQSCNEYQKALKNTEIKPKYDLAEELYKAEDYKRANRLFEQIAPKYIGKPQGERVMFFYAHSYFMIKDYNFAGYQFERFVKSYPNSDKAEQSTFLSAKSYYYLSSDYSLDQTDTDKALLKLQNFINAHPDSEYLAEANKLAKELTTKKERKAFEIARQYSKLGKSYRLEYSLSAVAALDNFLSDYPGSVYREDVMYQKVEAATNLALNSTLFRKKIRLDDAKEAYRTLKKYYPESKFDKKVTNLMEKVDKELQNYSK
ncbi:MAG: outer membrane protein assembly factor BamD [Cellulophaga sp.]